MAIELLPHECVLPASQQKKKKKRASGGRDGGAKGKKLWFRCCVLFTEMKQRGDKNKTKGGLFAQPSSFDLL